MKKGKIEILYKYFFIWNIHIYANEIEKEKKKGEEENSGENFCL